MDEIADRVNKSDVNDKFMKDYHNAKRHMVILNVISPGIVFSFFAVFNSLFSFT